MRALCIRSDFLAIPPSVKRCGIAFFIEKICRFILIIFFFRNKFHTEFDTIKKIASEGSCVIVGRCADYALNDYQNCLHVFIHADEASKIKLETMQL